MNRTG